MKKNHLPYFFVRVVYSCRIPDRYSKEQPDLELTAAISESVGIPVIASGGAGNLQHLHDAVVQGKADAVLCASIFHYREYSVREAKQFLADKGVPVRL